MKLLIGLVLSLCVLAGVANAQEPSNPQIPLAVKPDRFDQWGDVRLSDENVRLDKIAVQAKEWSLSIIYLVIHAGQTACVGEAKARGNRAKNYLMHRGISQERIVYIDAGWRKSVSVQVWIWPPQMSRPKIIPDELDLKRGAVKLEKNCTIRYRPESRNARRL